MLRRRLWPSRHCVNQTWAARPTEGPAVRHFAFVAAFIFLSLSTTLLAAGQFSDQTHTDPAIGSIQYRVYLPDGYQPTGTPWPVVLYLHSAAERGNSIGDIFANSYGGRLWTNDWIKKLVAETQDGKHKAVLVMPQSGLGQVWNSMTAGDNWGVGDYTTAAQKPISPRLQLAVDALKTVLAKQNVDRGRVYVTGPSMGGFGTWDALARFPDLFAAGMPLSGGGNIDLAQTVLSSKPIWMYHGGKDGLIPPGNTDKLYFAIRQAGGKVIYSRPADQGHGGFDLFYTPAYFTVATPQTNGGKGPDVYDWLFSQKLTPARPAATTQPAQTRPSKAPIIVGFGPGSSGTDRVDYTADGATLITFNFVEAKDLTNLRDINGATTGLSVSRSGKIAGGGRSGYALAAPINAYFPATLADTTLWMPDGEPTTFTFSGLESSASYRFEIFATIAMPADEKAPSQYVLKGAQTLIGDLDAANNKANVLPFAALKPTNGVISLTVRKSSPTSRHPYINAVRITPEP